MLSRLHYSSKSLTVPPRLVPLQPLLHISHKLGSVFSCWRPHWFVMMPREGHGPAPHAPATPEWLATSWQLSHFSEDQTPPAVLDKESNSLLPLGCRILFITAPSSSCCKLPWYTGFQMIPHTHLYYSVLWTPLGQFYHSRHPQFLYCPSLIRRLSREERCHVLWPWLEGCSFLSPPHELANARGGGLYGHYWKGRTVHLDPCLAFLWMPEL